MAEVLQEIDAELAYPHIDFGAILLPDAGIGVSCCGELIAGIAFDHQNPAGEIGVLRGPPCGGGAEHRAADDDDVIAGMGWRGGHQSRPVGRGVMGALPPSSAKTPPGYL